MADETNDVRHHEQLALLVKYFDTTENRLVETFLSLKRLRSSNAIDISIHFQMSLLIIIHSGHLY